MAYASPMKIANGLVLDFTVDGAVTATDAFLGLNALGEVTQFASVPRSRVSGGGNITESTSAVLSITGGAGAALTSGLTIQVLQAGAAQSGYLSTTDWNTFNNKLSSSLTSANIYVGNGLNIATGVAMSGDISITNAGVAAIATGVIVDADVNAGAAIAFSKMAALTANRIVASNGSGVVSILDTATYPSLTELSYVKGGTSAFQTQIDSKLSVTLAGVTSGDVISYNGAAWVNTPSSGTGIPTAGTTNQILRKIDNTNYNAEWHTLVAADLTDVSSSAAELNKLTGVTTTATQFNFSNTLVGDIQSQINAKLSSSLTTNSMWIGVAGVAGELAAGANGYVLTSVSGTPTWVSPGSGGTVTSVAGSGGTTGMSFTGSPITVSGTLTLTGTLIAANGGTGFAAYTVGDILYADTTTTLTKLAAGTSTHVLTSNGAGVAPSWQATGGGGLSWLLASGGTATGTNTFAMGSNPFIMTSGVTTGTGATAGHQLVGNSLTAGNLFEVSTTSTSINSTLGTSALAFFKSTGNHGATTANALSAVVTGTGTTNVAGYFEASGGTLNWALSASGNSLLRGAGVSYATPTFSTGTTLLLLEGSGDSSINLFNSTGAVELLARVNNSNGFIGTFTNTPLNLTTANTSRITIASTSGANNFAQHIYSTASKGTAISADIIDFSYEPGTFSDNAGSNTYNVMKITPVINAAGSWSGTAIGLDISATLTALASGSYLALRSTTGSIFFANASGDTPTASTRLDVRGISGGNILVLKDNTGASTRATLSDGGQLIVGNTTDGYVEITRIGNDPYINLYEGATNVGTILGVGSTTRIYAGSATGSGSLVVRASLGLNLSNASASQFGLWDNSGLNIINSAGALSTATQKNSPYTQFQSEFWDGAATATRYYGIKQIASTTVNLTGRLSFYENISTGSDRETMSISSSGNLNAAILSGTNVTLGGGSTASELRFLEPSSGSNYVGFKAPALAGNTVYDLPNAFPAVSGYVLSSTDAGVMSWVAAGGGSGDVVGPASSTDNAVARFDLATGKLIQNSTVFIDDNAYITAGTGLTGSVRELIADGSAANVGWNIRTKGTNDVVVYADLFAQGNFVVGDTMPTPTKQITINSGGTITASKVSADITNFGITGAAGISGFVTGSNITLSAGAAHGTGNNNGGHVYLMYGAKNGSGLDGNIGLLTNSVANWQAMERGFFVGNVLTAPTADPTSGFFKWSSVEPEGSNQKIRTSGGHFAKPTLQMKVTVAGGATLRAIGSAPQTIIAAPGANKYLNIISVAVSYNYASAVYDFASSESPCFKFSGGSNNNMILDYTIINAAADSNKKINDPTSTAFDQPSNTAFVLTTADGGDATTGDGDLDIVVYYTVEDANT